MIKNKTKIFILSLFLIPVVSFAAFAGLKGLIDDASGIIRTVYNLMFAIAIMFFAYSMIQVIVKSGDPKAREEARQRMIWGIVAIFILFSINGIVYWIGRNLCIQVGNSTGTGCSTSNVITP